MKWLSGIWLKSILCGCLLSSHAVVAGTLSEEKIPTFLAKLPVYRRDERAAPQLTDPEWFIREEAGSPVGFLADADLKGLLTSRFRFAQRRELQVLVDVLTERLFASKTIREKLCFLGSLKNSDFSHFLGVSKDGALELERLCAQIPVTRFDRDRLKIMKSQMPGDATFQRPKEFALILSLSDTPVIEGFTTREGLTVIALHQRDYSFEHLLRIWIHELAISFDQLSEMAPLTGRLWSLGLNEVLGFPRMMDPPLREGLSAKDLRCALRDPAIRYALAAERAFRFEDRIIDELGFLTESPALGLRNLSCAQVIGRRAVQISPIADFIRWETSMGLFYEECDIDLLKDARRTETLVKRINTVASAHLQLSPAEPEKALCDIILEPHIGSRIPDNIRHGGPRPRVGGWE